jgi:hypothetical protein
VNRVSNLALAELYLVLFPGLSIHWSGMEYIPAF